LEYISKSEKSTIKFGKEISSRIKTGDVISIYGELGTGKTTFIRGVCRGLGYNGIVNSPSYTIINQYNSKHKILHFDFYRLKNKDEIFDLGVDEFFFDDWICLIEWPVLAEMFLPDETKNVFIRYSEENMTWRIIKTDF